MPVYRLIGCLVISSGLLSGQTASTFDVASIRPSGGASTGLRVDLSPDYGLRATGVTLRYLIQLAWDVEDFQVSGGPSWISSERFDLIAKSTGIPNPDPAEAQTEPRRARLRQLLAERFHLVVRQELKDGSVYLLVPSNRTRLSPPAGNPGMHRNRGLISSENASLPDLAKSLANTLRVPVTDQTGLSDNYSFRLQWAEEGAPGEPEDNGQSIFTAIRQQLGLRLQPSMAPIKLVTVEKAERPTEN